MKKLFVLILSIVAAFATATLLTACEAKVDKDGNVTITDDNNNNDHDNNQQERVELTAADIYSKVNPSVVFILLEKKGAYVSGSGFFIDKNGTLVTNYHVIKDTFAGVIQLCDGTVENIVNVLGYDEKLDIAILETTAKNTPAVTKSNEQIRVGENVYAIGYPEAFILGASSSTFTTGMVSMNRSVNGYNYIQSTVDITNGNSGGVLINKYGEAVGITTAGINLEKIYYMNLSIPIQRVDTIQRNVNESLEITTKRHHPVYVTYMADGYTYNVQSITYETKTDAPADPAKVGYTFNGWYLDNGYKKPFDFETILLENTTLYAKFSINNYTVSYDLDEGDWGDETPPQTYTIDNCGTALPTPKREGYLFEWWLDGSGNYLLNYPNKSSLQNLSLKASWIKDAEGLVIENGVVKKYNGGLTKVVIPASFRGKSVTSISYGAFSGCSGLQAITIPFVGGEAGKTASDTYQYPFGYIFGTSSYDVGVATEQYYYGSSTSSTTSTTYYIPSSLKKVIVTGGNILYGAFSGCTSLTNITIPDSVTSIGYRSFYNCSSLTSITIPNSVKSIGDYAFENCKSLKTINYNGDINGWVQIDGLSDLMSYGSSDKELYINGELLTEAVIDTATEIKSCAFYGCSSLTSVTIGDSVTSIGYSAFYNCELFTSVTIPDSVTSIGYGAFKGCSRLESITLPFIGAGKTANSGYEHVFGYIFGYTKSSDTYINGTTCQYETQGKIYNSNNGYNKWTYYHYYYHYYIPTSLKTVILSDSVTSIGSYAFKNCELLTSVTIPDSVTSIGNFAFAYCSSLKTINYKGGKEQWDSISKGTRWNYGTGSYTINYNYVEN